MSLQRLSRALPRGPSRALLALATVLAVGSRLAADVPVVFASRTVTANPDSDTRASAIERAASGKLLARDADGRLRTLVDATLIGAPASAPVDLMDPDVSWDGTRVVFAGFSRGENAWRIYEVRADGAPHAGLRQITRSNRVLDLTQFGAAASFLRSYDDVDPCYLPDGRICFVSTRYPAIAPDGRLRGTNLYVVNADGTDVHRITSERFGADTPVVHLQTGHIVYSRWWRSPQFIIDPSGEEPPPDPGVDPGSPGYGDGTVVPPPVDGEPMPPIREELTDEEFPGLNNWFLATINPDGTGMQMFSGMGLDREQTQAWRPGAKADGSFATLFIPRTPFLGLPRGDGVRIVRAGATRPEAVGGPQAFAAPAGGGPAFVYASAEELADARLLVTAARTDRATDYDVYLQADAESPPVLLHALAGTWETGAVPLVARPVPPVIAERFTGRLSDQPPRTVEEAFARGGRFIFLVENIFGNAAVDTPIATAPPAVPGLRIQFFMNPQRTGTSEADPPILITEREIGPTGRVEVELPGGVPLFEVLRTESGEIPVGRDGQIFHVGGHNFGIEGQRGRCIGCHTGHSMVEVPREPEWTNLGPSAEVIASSSRRISTADDGTLLQRPENLVDLRTGALRDEWAAETGSASLELSWSLPIRAREVVLRGITPGTGELGARNQTINALRLFLLSGRERLAEVNVAGPIAPQGTRVSLDDALVFDRLQVVIRETDVSGLYEGQRGPALAEVEVLGRVFQESVARPFIRGDSNCDGAIEITDAVLFLDWLFRGTRIVCCRAGADSDANGVTEITDAVYVLRYLFQGGPQPPAPFPECAPASVGDLGCEGPSICF